METEVVSWRGPLGSVCRGHQAALHPVWSSLLPCCPGESAQAHKTQDTRNCAALALLCKNLFLMPSLSHLIFSFPVYGTIKRSPVSSGSEIHTSCTLKDGKCVYKRKSTGWKGISLAPWFRIYFGSQAAKRPTLSLVTRLFTKELLRDVFSETRQYYLQETCTILSCASNITKGSEREALGCLRNQRHIRMAIPYCHNFFPLNSSVFLYISWDLSDSQIILIFFKKNGIENLKKENLSTMYKSPS